MQVKISGIKISVIQKSAKCIKFSPSKYLGHTVCDTCTYGHMYDDHLYNWTSNIQAMRHVWSRRICHTLNTSTTYSYQTHGL